VAHYARLSHPTHPWRVPGPPHASGRRPAVENGRGARNLGAETSGRRAAPKRFFKKFSPARRPSALRKAKKFSRLLRIPAFLMVGPLCTRDPVAPFPKSIKSFKVRAPHQRRALLGGHRPGACGGSVASGTFNSPTATLPVFAPSCVARSALAWHASRRAFAWVLWRSGLALWLGAVSVRLGGTCN